MKTTNKFLLSFLILLITLCLKAEAQEKKATEILNDSKTKNEIMEAVCNDHSMMKEMMQQMMKNKHAKEMMKEDSGMMKEMMSGDQMEGMMKKDTSMSNKMMDCMMKMMKNDSSMCSMMCKMMETMQAKNKEDKMKCCMTDKTDAPKTGKEEDMKSHNH